MDIGSSERLAMQNLQIPDTAETRIIPKWLFGIIQNPASQTKISLTSSRPEAVLVAPTYRKTKK
jgi:hypothetical protein